MKKILLLFFVSLLSLNTKPQVKSIEPEKTGKKFFVGLSYTFMNFDMKLTDMSLHSVWYGEEMGIRDLTADEIEEINTYADRTNQVNGINTETGMVLYDKPGSKLKVGGTLILGLAKSHTRIYNNKTEKEEYTFESNSAKPCLGLGFNIAYNFTPRWGLALRPLFVSTFGTSKDIVDKVNPAPENFTQIGKDKYRLFYERISLMATFTADGVTIAAGPGFYLFQSHHKYSIERTSVIDGAVLQDEVISQSVARNFIDGSIAVEWKIIELLTLYVHAGIATDILVNAGLHFNF